MPRAFTTSLRGEGPDLNHRFFGKRNNEIVSRHESADQDGEGKNAGRDNVLHAVFPINPLLVLIQMWS